METTVSYMQLKYVLDLSARPFALCSLTVETISVVKHGLKIPMDAADYDEFAAKMEAREQEFKRVFAAYAPQAV